MQVYEASVNELELWLSRCFGGAPIENVVDHRRDVVLFRVRDRARSPFPEIQVEEDALEDWSAQEIIRALEAQDAIRRLRESPSERLHFATNGRLTLATSPF